MRIDKMLVKPYDIIQFLSIILRNIKNKKLQAVASASEEFTE